MIVCILGAIKEITGKLFVVCDQVTKEEIICEAQGDTLLEAKVGDTGVFVGHYYKGLIKINKVNVRKFLDPLYEDDLYDASGKFNLVPVINDPFTEAYLEYLNEFTN